MTDQAFSLITIACLASAAAGLVWLIVRRRPAVKVRVADRLRSSRADLRTWIEQHMPELDAELGPKSMDEVRIRLNEITGCAVQGGDSVENGSAVFLAALKKMKEQA